MRRQKQLILGLFRPTKPAQVGGRRLLFKDTVELLGKRLAVLTLILVSGLTQRTVWTGFRVQSR